MSFVINKTIEMSDRMFVTKHSAILSLEFFCKV